MKDAEQIKKTVVDQLAWDSRVDSSHIKVEAEQGSVTLSGTVPNFVSKTSAANIAWSVAGVTSVQNDLVIEFPANFNVPSDTDIQNSVQQRLLWSSDIDESDISVIVDSGLVTLAGSVPSFWQKTRSAQEAQAARGVVAVTNKLAVVPTAKISDEIIGQRIMDRIARQTTALIDNIDITVNNGQVDISGTVTSWPVRQSVYDAALYTAGVKAVNDNIVINPTPSTP